MTRVKQAAEEWIEETVRRVAPLCREPWRFAAELVELAEEHSVPIEELIERLYENKPERSE